MNGVVSGISNIIEGIAIPKLHAYDSLLNVGESTFNDIVTPLKKQANKSTSVIIPGGMNFDPVNYVKETLSRVGYAYQMSFDLLARHNILLGCFLITCLK